MYIRTLFVKICLLALAITSVTGIKTLAQQSPVTLRISDGLSEADSLKIKDLYFTALRDKAAGRLDQAMGALQSIMETDPKNDAALYELARICLGREDYGTAAAYAREATTINPDNEWYWHTLAEVYKHMEDYVSLVPVMDQFIRLKPDKQENYYDRAYALFLIKKYDESLQQYRQIEEKFGANDNLFIARQQIYLAQKQPQKAIDELEQLKTDKPDDKRAYLLLADLYLKLKKTKEAMSVLDSGHERFKDDPYISVSKADVYNAMRKESASFNEMKKAFDSDKMDLDAKIQVLMNFFSQPAQAKKTGFVNELGNMLTQKYPNDARAFAVNGDLLVKQERYNEARTQYIQAVKLDPKMDAIWEQLLQLEMTMGLFKEAEAHGREAVAVFPDHAVILFFTGQAAVINGDPKGARGFLEGALNNAPEDNTVLTAQIYSSLGDVYHGLDMLFESDVAYGEALAIDSNNTYVLNNYAYYLALRKERLDEASMMARKATDLEPGNASYEDTFAWVLFNMGKFEEALSWISKAIEHSTDESDTLLEHYGDILAQLGRTDEAVRNWEKAKQLAGIAGKDIALLSKKIHDRQYIP